MTKTATETASLPRKPPVFAPGFSLGFMAFCLFMYLLYAGAAIMIPFVIAVFVWYLINALARFLGRVRIGERSMPRLARYLLSIMMLTGGVWFGYKLIVGHAAAIIAAAPVYQKQFLDFLPHLLEFIPADYRPDPADIAEYLNVGTIITTLVKTFTGIAGKALVVLFYTGFLLYEQRFFSRKLREIAGTRDAEERVHGVIRNIDVQMQRYIGVKTLISLATGLCTWMLLSYFGINLAAFWGVMAFILHFIPYLGSILAIALPGLSVLVQTGEVSMILWVVTWLSLVQIFWTNIVEPRLMGDSLNLSPICIIFSLAAWGMIWGVPGMFLSVPILAMAVIILSQFDATRPFAVLLTRTGDIHAGDKQAGAQ